MLKKITLVFLLIIVGFQLKSQDTFTDSIVTRLKSIEDNLERFDQTRIKMRGMAFQNFDAATQLADFNIQWAFSTGDSTIMGKAFGEKAILYLMTQQYQTAKSFIKKSISILEKTKNNALIGYAYRNLGVAHFFTNIYDSSITAHFNALSYLDSSNQEHKQYYGLTAEELGKVFYECSNNKTSNKYAGIALDVFIQLKDSARIMDTYTMLALTEEDLDSSLIFLDLIIDYSIKKGDSARLYNAYANSGNILIGKQDYQQAKIFSRKAFSWFKNKREDTYIRVGVNLANIAIEDNHLDSANFYLDLVLPLAFKMDDTYVLAKAISNKATIERKKGNFEKALEYSQQAFEYELGNLGVAQNQQITALELELELNSKNNKLNFINLQNNQLEKEAQEKATFVLILSILSILLFGVLAFLYRSQLKLKVKNKKLFEQNEVIENQKSELEKLLENNKTLFSIIGHDLRTPINNLYSVLQLVPSTNDILSKDSEIMLDMIKQSTQTAGNLLENLLVWSKTQRGDFVFESQPLSLKTELDKILAINHLNFVSHKIDYKLQTEKDLTIKTDQFAFETIIRNIISNAVKSSPENSMISINWESVNGKVNLMIEDEAGGLPKQYEEFLKGENNDENFSFSRGLGLKLVKSLSDSTGTLINYEKTTKGSRFTFTFNC